MKTQKSQTEKSGRMFFSKCAFCDCKKLIFTKDQKASGILYNLGINTLLSKIPLVGPLLF